MSEVKLNIFLVSLWAVFRESWLDLESFGILVGLYLKISFFRFPSFLAHGP